MTESTVHDPVNDAAAFANRRVLLVEDDDLIALVASDLMESRGVHVVGPASTLAQALNLAQSEVLDAAVLDVNLGSETSFAAAALLKERAIPFFYTTAVANRQHPEITGEAFLAKPYGAKQFFQSLEAALLPHGKPSF